MLKEWDYLCQQDMLKFLLQEQMLHIERTTMTNKTFLCTDDAPTNNGFTHSDWQPSATGKKADKIKKIDPRAKLLKYSLFLYKNLPRP